MLLCVPIRLQSSQPRPLEPPQSFTGGQISEHAGVCQFCADSKRMEPLKSQPPFHTSFQIESIELSL